MVSDPSVMFVVGCVSDLYCYLGILITFFHSDIIPNSTKPLVSDIPDCSCAMTAMPFGTKRKRQPTSKGKELSLREEDNKQLQGQQYII